MFSILFPYFDGFKALSFVASLSISLKSWYLWSTTLPFQLFLFDKAKWCLVEWTGRFVVVFRDFRISSLVCCCKYDIQSSELCYDENIVSPLYLVLLCWFITIEGGIAIPRQLLLVIDWIKADHSLATSLRWTSVL